MTVIEIRIIDNEDEGRTDLSVAPIATSEPLTREERIAIKVKEIICSMGNFLLSEAIDVVTLLNVIREEFPDTSPGSNN